MPANNKNSLEKRVLQTANRLRLIQVDFADKSSQVRDDYLCEEIDRALKVILPEQKREFLQKLLERFPHGTFISQSITKEKEQKDRKTSIIDENKLKDADFLVHKLMEIIPTLTADQKESIAGRLQEIGLGSRTRETYPDESIEKLRAELQIGGQQNFNPERLTELIFLLTNFVYKLEPLGWHTWQKLSPRSRVRQSGDLKKIIGQFLNNDPEVSQDHVNNELKGLMQLIAALITATNRVGSQFAQHYLAKFSPNEIKALVKLEPKNILFSGPDQRCWKKYCELAANLTEDSIETEITKAIVNYVESLIKGMGR